MKVAAILFSAAQFAVHTGYVIVKFIFGATLDWTIFPKSRSATAEPRIWAVPLTGSGEGGCRHHAAAGNMWAGGVQLTPHYCHGAYGAQVASRIQCTNLHRPTCSARQSNRKCPRLASVIARSKAGCGPWAVGPTPWLSDSELDRDRQNIV